MHSDSFSCTNTSTIIPMFSCNSTDFAKKKRGNKAAKLKQCKLDARREQWLSQVKKKGDKEESDAGRSGSCVTRPSHRRDMSIEKLDIMSRGDKESDNGSVHHYSDSESPSNSPISHISSDLGGNDSVSSFTGSSRSSSSGGCCSESISDEDEEEEDDDCVDDWEAVADALAATEEKQEDQHCVLASAPENTNAISVESHPEEANHPVSVIDMSKYEAENGASVQRAPLGGRAWRPDDDFRPQSLPTLSKQYSLPLNSERHYSCGRATLGRKDVSAPASCPICFEDLDLTDSSFLPCSCGFGLCLFCYKRILEDDGRCPGCRKQYDRDLAEMEAASDGNNLPFRLARSCSLITRS